MLAVEVEQVVGELVVQQGVAAAQQQLRWAGPELVSVVVHPDPGSWGDFNLCDELPADDGFSEGAPGSVRGQLVEEAAPESLREVLVLT